MYSLQNIKLILVPVNSQDLPFRHALNKKMLLLKSKRVVFKKKALKKLAIMCDMFLKGKTEEMHGSLILMLIQFDKAWFHISHEK